MTHAAKDLCLLNFRPNRKASLRLFCFAYGGGHAAAFRPWADALPQEIDVWAVEYAGHGGRYQEQAFTRMEPLADDIAGCLSTRVAGPFAVFGHSVGGLIGFEVLRRLQRERDLAAIGFFPSASHPPTVVTQRATGCRLSDAEIRDELHAFNSNLAKQGVDDEVLDLALPTLLADFEVSNTYRRASEPKLQCPIFAYGGMTDTGVSRKDIEAWKVETDAACVVRMFPGDHFFIHSAETTLLRVLAKDLLQLSVKVPRP